jgi:UDP-N-acetylmuramoyl-tripeptide--D-alanyl-D-alanine ligase
MMTLAQLAQALPGSRLVGDPSLRVSRVHTDTRSLLAGDLFVALRGEHFDAHDFLAQAGAAGAVAAVAEKGLAAAGLAGVEVADSRLALGQLASSWRGQFALPLIAVTGSNGKTTVTQMLAAILRAQDGPNALATEGNFNNGIGVPLTLLRLRANHRRAVVELGMNHPGEIAQLAGIARPTVALVNNAQREHLEFMQTVAAVAQENGAVIAALPEQGVAVFPADDAFTPLWRELAGARRALTFALTGAADVTGHGRWSGTAWQVQARTPLGPLDFSLSVAGQHNVKNALAAVACALAAEVSLEAIAAGLSAFEPVKGRSRALQLAFPHGLVTVIDDTYNANPDSVRAAIDVLADLPAPRLLVLGDMGEVGEKGPQFHAEIGTYAQQRAIQSLLCSGPLMVHAAQAFAGAVHCESVEALVAVVLARLPQHASVLVKGSRFMRMERVVQALEAHRAAGAAAAERQAAPSDKKENTCF